MKIDYSELNELCNFPESKEFSQLSKFFFTFGFFIIKNAIDDDANGLLRQEVLRLSSPFLKKTQEGIPYVDSGIVTHRSIESNPAVLTWFYQIGIFKLVKALLGPNAIYHSSDANIFLGGARWHRDHALSLPSLKVLIYLQDSDLDTQAGDLAVIPGTQNVGDVYSGQLGYSLGWPAMGMKMYDNYGSIVDNTRIAPSDRIYDGSEFPSHRIKVNKSDIVVFDNRMFHTTYSHFSQFVRLNLSAAFFMNPDDTNPHGYLRQKYAASELHFHLTDFFERMLKDEDQRYHENLFRDDLFPDLQKMLYFKKYGKFDGQHIIYPSGDSQNANQKFHLSHHLPESLLRV